MGMFDEELKAETKNVNEKNLKDKSIKERIENYYEGLIKAPSWATIRNNWDNVKNDILFVASKMEEYDNPAYPDEPLVSFSELTHIISGSLIRTRKSENMKDFRKDLKENLKSALVDNYIESWNRPEAERIKKAELKRFVAEVEEKLKW